MESGTDNNPEQEILKIELTKEKLLIAGAYFAPVFMLTSCLMPMLKCPSSFYFSIVTDIFSATVLIYIFLFEARKISRGKLIVPLIYSVLRLSPFHLPIAGSGIFFYFRFSNLPMVLMMSGVLLGILFIVVISLLDKKRAEKNKDIFWKIPLSFLRKKELNELILLTCAVYFAPVFTILMLICMFFNCFQTPPYYILNTLVGINLIAFIVNIFALKKLRTKSGRKYKHFKAAMLYFAIYMLTMALLFGFCEFIYSSDTDCQDIISYLLIFSVYLIFAIFAIAYLYGKVQFKIMKENDFSPTWKHFFWPLVIAMLLSGGEMLFSERGLTVIAFFPAGLFAIFQFVTKHIPMDKLMNLSWLGWLIYGLIIFACSIFRSRTIWYIFLVLLLVNMGGCRLMLMGLYNIH